VTYPFKLWTQLISESSVYVDGLIFWVDLYSSLEEPTSWMQSIMTPKPGRQLSKEF